MPFTSRYPPLEIPKCNILSFVFPADRPPSEKPIWIDAANPSNSLSMADMLSWVKRLATGFDRLGVAQGQAVMVFTPNHIFVPLAYLAAAGSKRIFTGANPAYTVGEVAYQMKIVRAAIVLVHPSLLGKGLAAAKQAGIPISHVFQFAAFECPVQHGVRDWRDLTAMASVHEAQSWRWDTLPGECSQSTIAAINFSSGTTGLPKGVCITHYNLVSNAVQNLANKFHNTGRSEADPGFENWLATLPLYHAYSQLWTITLASRLQASVYVMSKFVFEDYLRYIEQYKITTLQAVPPILLMLSKRPETAKYNLASLQTILCGAAPLSRSAKRSQ
jgi:acyl-CoA synthetase (AMP-forming)/AMP-acid ligase II